MDESYNEQILQSIIDNTPYENENPYPSKIEVLLMELKDTITPIVKLTQAEYDALEDKDENTLYVIVEG